MKWLKENWFKVAVPAMLGVGLLSWCIYFYIEATTPDPEQSLPDEYFQFLERMDDAVSEMVSQDEILVSPNQAVQNTTTNTTTSD